MAWSSPELPFNDLPPLPPPINLESPAIFKAALQANRYPYVKIKVLEEARIAGRQTAGSYLQRLAELDVLRPLKLGREVYYINHRLMDLLTSAGS